MTGESVTLSGILTTESNPTSTTGTIDTQTMLSTTDSNADGVVGASAAVVVGASAAVGGVEDAATMMGGSTTTFADPNYPSGVATTTTPGMTDTVTNGAAVAGQTVPIDGHASLPGTVITDHGQIQNANPNAVRTAVSIPPKAWHIEEHTDDRAKMKDRIVALLASRRPNRTVEWHNKLPLMARKLEDSLFKQANSFAEYDDESTLKHRLQLLAEKMGKTNGQRQNMQQMGNGVMSGQPGMNMQQMQQMGMQYGQQPGAAYGQVGMQQMGMMPGQNGQGLQRPAHGVVDQYGQMGMNPQMTQQQQQMMMQQQQQQQMNSQGQTAPKFVNMQQINPLMSGQSIQGGQMQAGVGQMQQAVSGQSSSDPIRNREGEDHRRQVLKQQQQRLLLLRHASKCPHETKCSVTPHCSTMKELWKHIMSCKNHKCNVAHCVSSRYVLSHYSKCKDVQCPVCGPVREAIKRNYDMRSQQIRDVNNRSNGYMNGHDPARARRRNNTPLDPVSCAIYCFTDAQIQTHIKNIHEGLLLTAAKIRELFMPVVDDLLKREKGFIFRDPVDPELLNIPDYFEIVKMPMDLGSIKKRLETGYYRVPQNVERDALLVFDNAMLYNPKGSEVHQIAKAYRNDFQKLFANQLSNAERRIEENRRDQNKCKICGELTLTFEPPVFYCKGNKCAGQRIRRNSWYYTGGNDQYHWCHTCFGDLKEGLIKLPDCQIYKHELAKTKRKHDAENEENWVQCDHCERWVHQVCGMFNGRRNVSAEVPYICPYCLMERRKQNPDKNLLTSNKSKASDLPHNTLSRFLEHRVEERLNLEYGKQADREGCSEDEVEKAGRVYIRQVSCLDKQQPVRENFLKRYQHKGYPIEYPCRTKCLIVFQNIDGQDVLIFGLYVYEYNHRCPGPNQRRVYISYLDSVNYFRPKHFRTPCYQEVLISYLDYVRARGFHTAHIWACPPMKGDDYILHIHPNDQKTPKDDRLRQWYDEILLHSKERGIVHEILDLWGEFLEDKDPAKDATTLPYFEGDYWVGQAEDIIKDLNAKGHGLLVAPPEEEEEKTSGNKRKQKKRTRSTRLATTIGSLERDPVMNKLGELVKPMKAAHYVAKLRPQEYADEKRAERDALLEKEAKEASVESEAKKARKLQSEALGDDNVTGKGKGKGKATTSSSSHDTDKDGATTTGTEETAVSSSEVVKVDDDKTKNDDTTTKEDAEVKPEEEIYCQPCSPKSDKGDSAKEDTTTKDDTKMEVDGAVDSDSKTKVKGEDNETKADGESNEGEAEAKTGDGKGEEAEVKSDAKEGDVKEGSTDVASSKEGDEATKTEETEEEKKEPPKEEPYDFDLSQLKDNTEDVDDTQESAHFNTRLDFLSLCQVNRYQFDQLRRAKHTSMMVLYHLHNPDAPKFVPRCEACNSDILVGYRYHCDSCDIDFCDRCLRYSGQKLHHHQLRSMAVGGSNQAKKLTEEQRKERQRSIQVHLQLLVHSSTCDGCTSRNCHKMKDFIKHGQNCPYGTKKGCHNCKRIYNILQLHARSCRVDKCPVFKCVEIRAHLRNRAQIQQQMDDNRRRMMNEQYANQANEA